MEIKHVCQSCGEVMEVHEHSSWLEIKECDCHRKPLCDECARWPGSPLPCGGHAQAFAVMCGPRKPGTDDMKCTTGIQACDFCGGLGIVESAVAESYRKGQELRDLRVKRIGATQEQLARILRIPGIPNGEAVNAIEHGHGPIPERFERELRDFAKDRRW